jgi:hypothetical protein
MHWKESLNSQEDVRCKTHKIGLVFPRFQRGNHVTSLSVRSKSFSSTYIVQVEEKNMAVGTK